GGADDPRRCRAGLPAAAATIGHRVPDRAQAHRAAESEAQMTAELVGERFQLEHKIGAGGMGTVYRALDIQTGFAVAVKLFDARTAVDVHRAQREVQALARLAHPSIVAHVGDGITDAG